MSPLLRTDLPDQIKYPIKKSLNSVTRSEPIVLGLSAALILLILSFAADLQDMSVMEIIQQLTPIIVLIGGGKYARDRAITIETYDQNVMDAAATSANRAKAELTAYLEDDLKHTTADWEELEEANVAGPGEEEDDRPQLPPIG